MTNQILLSILVPVYNSGSTIERCINSLCEENVSDYEIVIVDDGSEDKSYEKLDHLSERFRFLKIVSQNNAGVSATRQKLITLGRIYVKEKEAHKAAHNCTGDRLHAAVHSKGNNGKEYCNDQGNTGCQSVKSVGKVYSVYCTNNCKKQYRNRKPSQIQIMSAPERDLHGQGYIGIIYKIKSKYSCHNNLQCHFLPWQKSV